MRSASRIPEAAHEEEGDDSRSWNEVKGEQDQYCVLVGLRLTVLCWQSCSKLEQLALEYGPSESSLKPLSHQYLPNATLALLHVQQPNLNSFRLLEALDLVSKSDHIREQSLAADVSQRIVHQFSQSHQRTVRLTNLGKWFIFGFVYDNLIRSLTDLAQRPCWTEDIDQSGQWITSVFGVIMHTNGERLYNPHWSQQCHLWRRAYQLLKVCHRL
ncbi:MAG: hypothetical protein J3Q66DRAFT_362752 [Benniella sp.]|nr:MAG: hypothetical protein J3Q66DRAFT_362752 [Benniella sp.]